MFGSTVFGSEGRERGERERESDAFGRDREPPKLGAHLTRGRASNAEREIEREGGFKEVRERERTPASHPSAPGKARIVARRPGSESSPSCLPAHRRFETKNLFLVVVASLPRLANKRRRRR